MMFDPFGLVLEVFNELYPAKAATVVWRQGMRESGNACYGCTDFEHVPPIVSVDVDLPVAGAVDVLAHELAHVAAGFEEDHGPAWEAAFGAIHQRYSERVEALEAEQELAA